MKNFILNIFLLSLVSIGLITGLFLLSEEIVHRNNSFLRRYPTHPITNQKRIDVKYDSYYFAGITEDSIYLGNHTAPLHLLAVDRKLKDSTHIKVTLEEVNNYKFRSVKINTLGSFFFLSDGTVPIIYRGKLGDWRGEIIMKDKVYFSHLVPMNKSNFVFRARSAANNENELGKIHIEDSTFVGLYPDLLDKQVDGIFDTDGFLFYNDYSNKVIYLYRYRNQFIVGNSDLSLDFRGTTIDTISQAQLNIAEISSKNQKTLGLKTMTVNSEAAISGNLLFTSSERLGQYESEKMLKQATIVDVYDIKLKTYNLSFYLYNYQNEKMREFIVRDDELYMLIGKYLISYTLNPNYFEFKTNKNISADIRSKTENL